MPNNIVQFSGGKDSTATALEMLERGEKIHSVVAFDTGWEFPWMYDHWKKFEQVTGLKITVLHPREPFDYIMFDKPIKARKGPLKGQIHRIGNGWPSWNRRWCTRIKVNALDKYTRTIPDPVVCIGFAADEARRTQSKNMLNLKFPVRYPLIEYGITEAQALKICYDAGFDWGGYITTLGAFPVFVAHCKGLTNSAI
jgi:3'-phosphoadenosine 5'-phosphosulfate sulfotransferase (PAPS reductase)/FAD synthetase